MDRTGFGVKDANLIETKALPNGVATIYTDAFDLGALSDRGIRDYNCELLIEAPALVVGDLGNGDTIKYDVQCDNDVAFGSPRTLGKEVLTQTGAAGAGAAASSVRFRLPTDCERYVRVAASNSGAGDASDKSVTVSVLF